MSENQKAEKSSYNDCYQEEIYVKSESVKESNVLSDWKQLLNQQWRENIMWRLIENENESNTMAARRRKRRRKSEMSAKKSWLINIG